MARTLPTTHSSWKALFQSGWSTSSPMPLQYSQYAGYHPNWPESMIAATLGLNPCVKRVLGGNRSLWVHAVYLGRIRSCVAVERDTLPIYWSFSSCSSPLHILTCPSAWHRQPFFPLQLYHPIASVKCRRSQSKRCRQTSVPHSPPNQRLPGQALDRADADISLFAFQFRLKLQSLHT